MKLKSIIASVVLVAFVSIQTFAQEAQLQPKYDNDLDRAMCVFNKQVKNEEKVLGAFAGGGLMGLVGAAFLWGKAKGFESFGDNASEALTSILFDSPRQKQAFLEILSNHQYFTNNVDNFLEADSKIFDNLLRIFKTIPDRDLQNYISKLENKNLDHIRDIAEKLGSDLLARTRAEAKGYTRYFVYLSPKAEQSAKLEIENVKKIAALIDNWTRTLPNQLKINNVINKKLAQNSYSLIKNKWSETKLKTEMNNAFEKSNKLKGFGEGALLIGFGLLLYAGLSSTKEIEDTEITASKYLFMDLPMVRNYFANPDNQYQTERLAAQAQKHGCM